MLGMMRHSVSELDFKKLLWDKHWQTPQVHFVALGDSFFVSFSKPLKPSCGMEVRP